MSPQAPAIQGVALPNSKEPGYSPIYRNINSVDSIPAYETSDVTTLFESFETSVKRQPKTDCLGHREYDKNTKVWGPYVWQSYEQIHARRNNFGAGLLTLFEEVSRVCVLCWCC
jgi:long-chain acyl-CoA synthetase